MKLIAGDVNRVRDPWAILQQLPTSGVTEDAPANGPYGGVRPAKEFIEKSFFEYHLYTLTAPSTVRDKEVKQLTLLKRTGIKAERRYVYDPQGGIDRNLAVELTVKNEKENHLGIPLPKGRVALEQLDADGESALVGRADIDHTPVKEEVTLHYGRAFDVVGELKQTDPTHFEMRVRNHQAAAVNVRAVVRVGLGQKIGQASSGFVMHDVTTAHFDFGVRPNAQEILRYTVEGKPENGGAIP